MDRYKVQDVVPFEGRFSSWEAFDVARKAHGEKTHTMYVCRNTVKVETANKRRKLQVPASWVYDRKVSAPRHSMQNTCVSSSVYAGVRVHTRLPPHFALERRTAAAKSALHQLPRAVHGVSGVRCDQ